MAGRQDGHLIASLCALLFWPGQKTLRQQQKQAAAAKNTRQATGGNKANFVSGFCRPLAAGKSTERKAKVTI